MNDSVEHRSGRAPVIGLTGGIGAGKSTVAGILATLGCVVSDSDRDAAAVLETAEVKERLQAWWGDQIIASDGTLDRRAIATQVFDDPRERGRLENLVHPLVHERRRKRFEEASPDSRALVIDAPLLFEAGLDEECHAIIFVDAPRELRVERVKSERGWDESEIDRREAAQLPIEEKRIRATAVITNNATADRLENDVRAFLESMSRH